VLVYASMKRRGNTMNIDYSIILTRKEIESITEEKYNFIKNEVKRIADEAERIIQANKPSWVIERGHYKILHKENYARETVFLKDYKDENFNIKTLMTSKIIYSNTEMVINILLSKNITFEKLERIINRIEKIKQLAILNSQILDESTTITDKNLNYLCALLKKYYPYENRNYMIGRLVDIVVHEKDLYLSLQGKNKEIIKTR